MKKKDMEFTDEQMKELNTRFDVVEDSIDKLKNFSLSNIVLKKK